MSKQEILKIIGENLELIIDTAISLGYYDKSQKNEIIKRISENLKNGIVFDTANSEIYGAFLPNEKTIHLNNNVFKDKLTLLIYFVHELIHVIDFDGKNHGFQLENGDGRGINEGATQRKAENIAKKILQVQSEIKLQESIGCQLQTDLDEYQIQDKVTQLYATALGIPFETILRLQGLNGAQGIDYLNQLEELYSKPIFENYNKKIGTIISSLDGIYDLQEKTWFDSNYDVSVDNTRYTINSFGNLVNEGLNSRSNYLKQIQDELVKIFIYRNFIEGKINNELEYRELLKKFINEFIIKDESYLDRYSEFYSEFHNTNDTMFVEYQNQYNEIENWILKNINLENRSIVNIIIENKDDSIESIINKGATVYFWENDSYYFHKIKFHYDENGKLSYSLLVKEQCDLEEVAESFKENECDGNYMEYIEVLLKLGRQVEAKKIAIRHNFYEQVKDLPLQQQITEPPAEISESNEIAMLMNMIRENPDTSIEEENRGIHR